MSTENPENGTEASDTDPGIASPESLLTEPGKPSNRPSMPARAANDGPPTERPPAPEDADPVVVATQERDKLRDQLLRTAADFDNYRKRTRKDLEEADRKGREDVIREMLPVFDNLERAIGASQSAQDVASVLEGIQMVLKLFEDQCGRLNLTRIKSLGEKFDPNLHEAIQQVETDEHPPGSIINEVVSGYQLGGKLIRPAMVVVAKKPTASA